MLPVSRRNLFGRAAAVTGAGLFSGIVNAASIEKWDKTVDLLIVGTGFAGLACALEAHGIGIKNVLVVDKMPTPGGNSIINGGGISVAGSDMQKSMGIDDSPDLLYADIMRAGGGLAHPDLARKIADEALDTYTWLKDRVGVRFQTVYYHGGHSVKRSHQTVENSGSGYINPMLAKCREYGIPVQLRTKVEKIITDDTGAVAGVTVRSGYRFGKDKSGRLLNIRTLKGVVIAAGGFSQNVKMRMSHDPRLTDAFTSTNHPGATGEMIQQAQMIGANTIQMDWIQLGPWTSPDEKGFGNAPLFVEASVGYGPMIDIATGKRFIKETGNRKVRADAIVAMGHPALIYATEESVRDHVIGVNMTQAMFDSTVANGVIRRFATLREMAGYYKIPADELEKTNRVFNDYIRNKKDPEFDCMFFKDTKPLETGPFYAARLWPRVHHCMGGLEINNRAEVLNARGEVIPGLFAAGEVTGGVHGQVRLGTVAVADCMIFGRQAARSAKDRP